MKQFIFGCAAIIMAASTAAFTAPKANAGAISDSYFEFNTAYAPTKDNVEDESNWDLVSDMTGCPSANNRACKIRVAAIHVSGSALLSTADIQATEVSNIARVTGGELVDFVNRSNP